MPTHRVRRRSSIPCAAFLAALAVLACAGCVQRRLTIRSNPPGAFVYIDNYPIGVTPVSTDFVYYGAREFRLVRDGYETLTVVQDIRPPWYEWFGIDFISENLVPTEIRDERQLAFQLAPQRIAATDQLYARAEELRRGNQPAAYLAPMAPGAPPPAVVPGGVPAGSAPTFTAPPSPGQPTIVPPAALPPAGAPYRAPSNGTAPSGTGPTRGGALRPDGPEAIQLSAPGPARR